MLPNKIESIFKITYQKIYNGKKLELELQLERKRKKSGKVVRIQRTFELGPSGYSLSGRLHGWPNIFAISMVVRAAAPTQTN